MSSSNGSASAIEPTSWSGWTQPSDDATGKTHAALRLSASVLSQFDPSSIEPFEAEAERRVTTAMVEARARLRRDSETVGFREGRTLFALRENVRRAALAALGTRERMEAALRTNKRPNTPTQRYFERIIARSGDFGDLDFDEAAAGLIVIRWLEGVLDGIPSRKSLERHLGVKEISERLDRIAGREFLGREDDLDEVERLLATDHPEPLLVYGPGGIGKSTLVARLARRRFPEDVIVWLDADRPSYDFARLDTVLNEILRQARPQLMHPALDNLHASVRARSSTSETFEFSKDESEAHYVGSRFGRLLGQELQGRKMLIVVDTFEEVQLRGEEVESSCAAMLARLCKVSPNILSLFAGRAKPGPYAGLRIYNLHELGADAARKLLRELIPKSASEALPTGVVDSVAKIVGGNPLSLRLAASVIARAPTRDLGLDPLAEVLAAVRTERMQGMLYARILSHIRSDDARKVALPGLVVRLLTAELIEEVLAGPCGLELPDAESSVRIMNELAREVALLEPEAGGGLRHRQDVRRIMIQDLLSHLPAETVSAIDEGAIDFWASKEGAAARAEEIYHRLRLGQDSDTLDSRWLPEAAPYLRNAMEEIPPRGQLWLAEKLDISVGEPVRDAADLAEWEAQAERRVRRFLGANQAERALQTVRERQQRSDASSLYAVEGEILRVLGRDEEARDLALRGSKALAGAGAFGRAAELRLLASLVDESAGKLADALAEAEAASRFADTVHDAVTRLRPLVTRIRLLRKLGRERSDEYETLRSEALSLATPDMIERLRGRRAFVREVVAELGAADARILKSGITTLGLDTRSEAERQTLATALSSIGQAPRMEGDEPVLESPEVASWLGLERGDTGSILKWLEANGGAALSGRVAERLASESLPEPKPVEISGEIRASEAGPERSVSSKTPSSSQGFTEFFRAGVDSAVGQKWN